MGGAGSGDLASLPHLSKGKLAMIDLAQRTSCTRARPRQLAPGCCRSALRGALYAVNIAGVAPVLGITRGESPEPLSVALQRLGLHVFFVVLTALATQAVLEDHR